MLEKYSFLYKGKLKKDPYKGGIYPIVKSI